MATDFFWDEKDELTQEVAKLAAEKLASVTAQLVRVAKEAAEAKGTAFIGASAHVPFFVELVDRTGRVNTRAKRHLTKSKRVDYEGVPIEMEKDGKACTADR